MRLMEKQEQTNAAFAVSELLTKPLKQLPPIFTEIVISALNLETYWQDTYRIIMSPTTSNEERKALVENLDHRFERLRASLPRLTQ